MVTITAGTVRRPRRHPVRDIVIAVIATFAFGAAVVGGAILTGSKADAPTAPVNVHDTEGD